MSGLTEAPQVGRAGTEGPATQRPATYRDVFAVREYRAIFLAQVASLLGDQAAAVALAVLLYQRTGSALVAALGYATAYLPWTVGGLLLSPLADRLPPRGLLVGCDAGRALLIGVAAIPGLPLPLVGLLVLVAAFLAPPFEAAQSALIPRLLTDQRYEVALSLGNAVHQAAQLAGFLLGGALVLAISPAGALAVDAATFALSGLLLRHGLRGRPAPVSKTAVAGGTLIDLTDDAVGKADAGAEPTTAGQPASAMVAELTAGLRVVAADRRRYGPLLLAVCGAAYVVVPEAIAPAYVHRLGHGPAGVGLVMASVAAGTVLGNLLLGRFTTAATRRALMWPMAFAGTLPLLAVLAGPGLWASAALFAAAGLGSAFQVAANGAFVAATPPQVRGRAFGVAMAAMYGAQAIAIVAAGAAATVLDPRVVVALAAALGALALVGLRCTALRRCSPADHRAGVGRAQVAC
jgi:MFS family permease